MSREPNAIDLARTMSALKSVGAIHNDIADTYNYVSSSGSFCYQHAPKDLRKAAFANAKLFVYFVVSGTYEAVDAESAPCSVCSK